MKAALWPARPAALLLALVTLGCGHVRSVWLPPAALAAAPIKRLRVAAFAPADRAGLGPMLTALATDYLKLRKNFLVYEGQSPVPAALSQGVWQAACTDPAEGVLFVRTLAAASHKTKAREQLELSVELFACGSGDLRYRAEGALTARVSDPALAHLQAHYAALLGPSEEQSVPCAFSLLQELLAPLTSPVLSDEELIEKIELD